MTGTDLREALRGIADTTPVPEPDRVALQRLVRRERRSRLAGRAALALTAAAAVVAVGATTVVPFVTSDEVTDPTPAVPSLPEGVVDLETPVYLVADGVLTAIDPQGGVHDLGVRAEEVIGYTSESVYVVGTDSRVVRFDATTSDEGPGDWHFEQVDSGVPGPVQSAQLSVDGRWLGWIDLEDRLHTFDLKAGTRAEPVDQPRNTFLVDLAQGTGSPLVSQDGDLVLLTRTGDLSIPTAADGYGVASTASRDLVAVVDRDSVTRIYDVSSGAAELVDSVPGAGALAPYGDRLASVTFGEADTTAATVWTPGAEPVPLDVPGRPQSLAWADDDTLLVASDVGGQEVLYGCEVSGSQTCALLLEPGAPVRLAR